MNQLKKYFIAGIISGTLLILSYSQLFSWLIFIFSIPLIYTINTTTSTKSQIVSNFSVFSLIWNLFNYQFLFYFKDDYLNWIAPLGIILYALFTIIPFLFFLTKLKNKLLLFACCWIIIEQLFLHWPLKSPFSSLGIILGNYPKLIQWYQFTGIFGGSAWILLVNILLYLCLKKFMYAQTEIKRALLYTIISILLPMGISLGLSIQKQNDNSVSVRVFSFDNQTNREALIEKIFSKYQNDSITPSDYTVFPELIIHLQNQPPEKDATINKLQNIITNRKANENLVLGANLEAWRNQQILAVSLNNDTIQKRYKSILVPFGEKLPFQDKLKELGIFKKYNPTPYLTPNTNNRLFVNKKDTFHVSLCYESFFENHLKTQINSSTDFILIVAREPFLYNTHFKNITKLITKIQAITFQKSIARSSWCGVSCIMNNQGETLKSTYNTNIILEDRLPIKKSSTFFNRCKINLLFVATIILFIAGIFIRN
ncbi:hypothetical protein [Alkalitalea saponilacus]|uniref:Apolipoprotein N-acyltransferase n=1 Tax=Alkalitalea saponilacus TaxID=889453 RepID=A0A1T5AXF4_9BACT|nr:hypothetical protein [Alkalitalea saponilacus]ASB48561.1 hypothetical protein CDL62_05115 [Alkalitalea saponilacus]SKB39678.1 apolipoprotein N-acyltransferase [Alkalitalea saponilacus]